MKILKKLGIILLAIILLLVIIAFFLPSKMHMERSIEIKASQESVYNLVNNLHKWEEWSPWHKLDTAMVLTYSEPAEGVNSWYAWKSDNENVGNGKLTITETTPSSGLMTKLEFGDMDPSFAQFKFEQNGEMVKVTWTMDSDFGFNLIGRYFGLLIEKFVGPDYEKGLAQLKSVAESAPAKPTIAGFDFEQRTMEPMHVMGIRTKMKITDLKSDNFASWYKEINHAIAMQKLAMSGPPMTIYYSYDSLNTELEAAIPVSGTGKKDGTVNYHDIKGGNNLIVHYFGNYGNLSPVYNAAFQYIAQNGLKSTGAPMEIYVTDPSMEKDTSKWLTELVFPIE